MGMDTTQALFKFGDDVVHAGRPEWGPGTVTRAENINHEGRTVQRLHVRFPGVGMKVLNTGVAEVARANGDARSANGSGAGKSEESRGWLGALETQDPQQVMIRLPEAVSDPFRSIWQRLAATIDLYRFSKEPKSLTEWAIAQSGMVDPLTAFTRQEIEALFDRWMRHRDEHLKATLVEAHRADPRKTQAMLANAHPETQRVVQRVDIR